MANPTFEYCSLQYLNQWLSRDKKYHEVLQSNNKAEKLIILKEAASFYRVARNFLKQGDVAIGLQRYEPVLEIIDNVTADDFQDNVEDKILEIRDSISRKYLDREVLSATTKFLWLKVRNPVIIYDNQARIAVGSKNGCIKEYYCKWNELYEKNSQNIKRTCDNLCELRKYTVNPQLASGSYIKEVSSQKWFKYRVFDIYLWNKGNNA